MADLDPDGLLVDVGGGVAIRSPGLRGQVEVHYPGGSGMRAAEETTQAFLDAMNHNDISEYLTIEINEQSEPGVAAAGTRAAGDDNDMVVEVPAPGIGFGQVLLYEAEDGSLSWHFPIGISPADVPTRGAGTLTYRVPREVVRASGARTQRGLLGAAGKKLLKVLFYHVADKALGAVGNYFAQRFEASYRPYRLRPLTPDDYKEPTESELGPPDWARLAKGPALLFVHGTASRSHAAFGGIPQGAMDDLHRRYEGRTFGFDHHTISATPNDNVAWFARRLPPNLAMTVDILAHSRGGLVSRVLSEHASQAGLHGRIAVRNLVLVATPNAGTALADKARLDQLLNRLTNLLQLVPDNGVTDVLDIVLAIVKQVAIGVFGGLDGIMAMNPQSDSLKTFNRTGVKTARYFAVAANYDPPGGSSLLRIARDGVTDVVFDHARNDLVVPTEGAYSAPDAPCFPIEEPLLFEATDGVDHSGYWRQPRFVKALSDWLPG